MIKNPSKYKSNPDIEKLYINPSGSTVSTTSISPVDTINNSVQNSGFAVNDDHSVTVTIGGRT